MERPGIFPVKRLIAAAFIILMTLTVYYPALGEMGASDDQEESGVTRSSSEKTRALSDAVGLEYIAIGESRFRDEIEPLINWKTKKGVRSGYFTLDGENGILSSYNGRDVQEKVRNFIQDTWIDSGGREGTLKWILLVGDGEIIPPRRTFVNGSSENGGDDNDNYVMSDLYYAGLSNTWDQDNDGVFGEEDGEVQELDAIAEVYVGRFPASTEEELKIMVDRQLQYERKPVRGSWTDSMLLAGSLMDAPNNQGLFDPYKDNAYELVTKVEDMLPEDIATYKLLDYPRLEWGGYNRMFDTLNATSFKQHFEAGFSTVLMACHGDINGNCTHYAGNSGGNYPYWADYGVYFNYTTAETIENGMRTPFVYISNCDSLNFTESDDTNMERIMRNKNGGAIGVIGASVTTYRGEYFDDTSWGNWWLAEEFFEILYYNTSRPGKALYKLKEDYVNHVHTKDLLPIEVRMFNIDNLAYNLLGDPEGPLWLRGPRELEIEYPDRYYQGNSTMKIKVRDETTGAFVKDARVCIMDPQNESIYKVGVSNEQGEVTIPLILDELGELDLTVTKEGYIPWETVVDVVSRRNVAILEDLTLVPEIPVNGSSFQAIVKVANTGDIVLEGITLKAVLGSPGVPDEMIRERSSIRLIPGEIKNWSFSFGPPFNNIPNNGIYNLKISARLPPGPLESDTTDNTMVYQFRANEPPSLVGLSSGYGMDEDTRLSDTRMVDLSDYYIDDGFPGEPVFTAEVVSGNLMAEISDGSMLDIVPQNDWYGSGEVKIFASDGSVTVSRILEIEVDSVPDAPAFRSWPDSVEGLEDTPLEFNVEIFDVDSTEGNLTLSAPGWENITFQRLENTSALVYSVNLTPGEEDLGPSVLVIRAKDETDLFAEVRISMEISTTNDPPVAEFDPEIKVKKGEKIRIPIIVTDPDNDIDIKVGAAGPIVSGYSYQDGELMITPLDGLETKTYTIDIWVDDNGTRGNRSYKVSIRIVDEEQEPIFLTFIILVIVILLVLIAYGVFVRSQESRQRKMLDRVEDEVRMSKPKGRRNRRREAPRQIRKGSIQAPPAPSDVEASLARKGIKEIESEDWDPEDEEEETTAFKDLESELDEVLDELYPGSENR